MSPTNRRQLRSPTNVINYFIKKIFGEKKHLSVGDFGVGSVAESNVSAIEQTYISIMQKCNFDLAYARGKYDRLVKTHLPMLSMYDFKEECGFPLDKECSVFFAREVDCKKKTDFLIIDRKVLDFIGFRNGNFQIDLCKALDRLRKIAGFIEGHALNDRDAHFVVLSSSVWIRVRHLEYFMIMANTSRSYFISTYLGDLNRIAREFSMYKAVYCDKKNSSKKK